MLHTFSQLIVIEVLWNGLNTEYFVKTYEEPQKFLKYVLICYDPIIFICLASAAGSSYVAYDKIVITNISVDFFQLLHFQIDHCNFTW